METPVTSSIKVLKAYKDEDEVNNCFTVVNTVQKAFVLYCIIMNIH